MPGAEELIIDTRLPRSPACGAMARRLIERHLEPLIGSRAAGDVKLVVSELVNNAYLHGQGVIELVVQRLGDRLRVEVVDEGSGAAVSFASPDDGFAGHGLQIVEDMALAWGSHPGTAHVWAELPI